MRPASTPSNAPATPRRSIPPEPAHEQSPRPPSHRRARHRPSRRWSNDRQRDLHHPNPERRQRRHIPHQRRRHRHPSTPERQELHLSRQLLQRRGLERRHQPLEPPEPPQRGRDPDLHQARLDLELDPRQGPVRHHPHRLQDGLPRRLDPRRRPLLPETLVRRRRPNPHVDRSRPQQQRHTDRHRQRRRPNRLPDHLPSRPLLRITSMPKSRTRPSKASGALAGALLFGASPAFAQMTVFDPWNYAIQGALKSLQQGMSNTLTSITNQLTATGPLGTLLGSAQYGSVTALLQQGFTQNANYAKAQVDAQSQIIDGALTSNARFERDIRNASIRDEQTISSVHCDALDGGQTVTASGGQSWKVTQSIQDVADNRGEAGPNQPAFYGQTQAVAAISQLHYSRYCSQSEATAGLCSLSQTPNADQRASTLFGTGTLSGQAGVTAANDYVTNLIQPIVPAALRGDQLTSEVGTEGSIRRHAYNARISLARHVLNYAIGIQSPSVPLNSAQQTQMQNDGLTPISTGSWLQVLMLDANRRYSDTNYAAQLQAMPPASVNREIALELASTNYLLTQLLRVGIMHASTSAAHLAEDVERDFIPAVPLTTPNID